MNKKIFLIGLTVSMLVLSCSSEQTSENEEKIVETTVEETIEDNNEETSTEVEFMGVDKGDYVLYGHTDFDPETAVSAEEMFNTFEATKAFKGAVKVVINEVCQKAGCWINIVKPGTDEAVMVFFRDHFTIPIETSAGKEAVLYGELVSDTMTVDFQKHLLDDAAENGEEVAQEEYDAITEDKISQSFDCESILIKK